MSIAGPVMLDLQGVDVTSEEKELLDHPKVGGVILFARNFQSPDQLIHFTKDIRRYCSNELLIAVDQEGGRVQRFKEGFTPLPSHQAIGQIYQSDSKKAMALAKATGWMLSTELLACGVDVSFAPVLDLNKGVSQVIGDRSFHRDPEIVTQLGKAFCEGMEEAGMSGVGKHFPGHGSVRIDSHKGLPMDEREWEEIENSDLIPFKKLASTLKGMMPAHIVFKKLDPLPAGFSTYWLQEILRKKLLFKGAIFSDDLTMEGAAIIGNYSERAHAALKAGCDMILVCNHRQGTIEIVESLRSTMELASQNRLLMMRGRFKYSFDDLKKLPQWVETHRLLREISP